MQTYIGTPVSRVDGRAKVTGAAKYAGEFNATGLAYAQEHDRHYGVTHRVDTWYADLFLEIGPEADARRSRAMPLLAREPERLPDSPTSGPEVASDDSVRARFFGED